MRCFLVAALAASLASAAAAQGTIRVAVGTTLNQLDLAKTTIGDEYIYVHLVFNGLTSIDRDLTVKPDLATSWDVARDFSNSCNPIGQWSYGSTPTLGGSFTLFTRTGTITFQVENGAVGQWVGTYSQGGDRKSTRLNSSHRSLSRMPSSA